MALEILYDPKDDPDYIDMELASNPKPNKREPVEQVRMANGRTAYIRYDRIIGTYEFLGWALPHGRRKKR